jgi:hypothetical protein
MIRTFVRRHRRNAVVRQARALPPRLRPQVFRAALYGGETDQKLLLSLAELALESNDPTIAKYVDALRAGRRVKVGTYPTKTIEIGGFDANLVFEIESSFPQKTEGESR